ASSCPRRERRSPTETAAGSSRRPSARAPHRPRAEAAHASARQLVDLSVERGRVELTGGVLAERRNGADLEPLLALARPLAVHGAEAPDLARAEVPVEVAP